MIDRPGAIAAWAWNRLVDAARSHRLREGSGATLTSSPSGQSILLPENDAFFARLVSGPSGGPYRFRRVVWKDGAWVDVRPEDDPAVAYEGNLLGVPIGRVVIMRGVAVAGEYRFWMPRGGGVGPPLECPCPGLLEVPTLRLLDPVFGELAIVRNPSIDGAWYGCRQVSVDGTLVCGPGRDGGTVSTKLFYRFRCDGNSFHLLVRYRGCLDDGGLTVVVDPGTMGIGGCGGTQHGKLLSYPVNWTCPPAPGFEPPTDSGHDGNGQLDAAYDLTAFLEQGLSFNNASNSGILSYACTGFCVAFRGPDLSHNILTATDRTDGGLENFRAGYDYHPELGVHCGSTPYFGLYDDRPADTSWHHTNGAGFFARRQDILILDPAAPPPGTGTTLCVRVQRPSCTSALGPAEVGATVQMRRIGEATVLQTVVSGADGLACFTPTDWGAYEFTATKSLIGGTITCTGRARAVFGPCSDPDAVIRVDLCCARMGLVIGDDVTSAKIEGAKVYILGVERATSDANGNVAINFSYDEMLRFPAHAPGELAVCHIRRVPVEVRHPDYLSRCLDIVVECGSNSDPNPPVFGGTGIRLKPKDIDGDGLPDVIYANTYHDLCVDQGCTNQEYHERAMLPVEVPVRIDYAEVQDTSGVWRDVRGPGLGGIHVFQIDQDTLKGDPPATGSPMGDLGEPEARIEYHNTSLSDGWDPHPDLVGGTPCPGSETFASAEGWFTSRGLVVDHVSDGTLSDVVQIPGQDVDCAQNVGRVRMVMLVGESDRLPICQLANGQSITYTGEGTVGNPADNRRFRYGVTIGGV